MKRIGLVVLTVLFAFLAILPGCRVREVGDVSGYWLLLAEDPDEANSAYNAQYLYVDSNFTDGVLNFKMVPYATIPNAADSVLMVVYLDADQNASTGLSSATAGWTGVTPQSVGAEFMMFVGSERNTSGSTIEPQGLDTIFAWNDTDTTWDPAGLTVFPYHPASADSVKGGINESTMGNPAAVDVEAVFVCAIATADEYRDLVPNTGHATIDLANDTVIPATSAVVNILPPASSSSGVSFIYGKPRNDL